MRTGQLLADKPPLVLAVDDDYDNLVLISQLLTLFGCSCITALDGKTTLSLARSHRPHLILLDIRLPDMNGVELIGYLKQERQLKNIPLIAVTSLAAPEDRERILLAGCNDYICKPYGLDELEVTVQRYLKLR